MIKDFEEEVDKIYLDKRDTSIWMKYMKEHPDLINSETLIRKHFFPLNTFILDIRQYDLYVLVELKNNYPLEPHITSDNYEITVKRENENHRFYKEGKFATDIPSMPRQKQEEFFNVASDIVISFMLYVEARAKEVRVEQRLSPNILKTLREDYEYRPRECYFFKDIINYAKLHPTKASIHYRCECWGVRGHFRHYGTGQVIFIKPYLKGAKKDIIKPHSNNYLLYKEGEEDEQSEIL